MKRRVAALGGVAAAWLFAAPVLADTPPSVWDVAREPGARARYDLHAQVIPLLAERELPTPMRALPAEQARALLEAADAEHSPDVRLRFDLGRAYERLDRYRRAIEILKPAVEAAPDHPAVATALLSLALAYAKLDEPIEERATYKRYLAIVTTDEQRATPVLNLAEAEMRLGNLKDAIIGYREAIDIASRVSNSRGTVVLGFWGLAVALDRAGDPTASAKQTQLANQFDPGQGMIGDNNGNVFFVPRHERYWYLALGVQEEARGEPDARKAARLWKRTVERWSGYIEGAERFDPTDRWLPLAHAHLASAKRELASVEARAAKLPQNEERELRWPGTLRHPR